MLEIRELIRRVQLGETDRRIARDLQVSRKTVSKYRAWAQQQDLVRAPLPDAATLQAQLQTTLPVSPPPVTPSKVASFREQVIALRQRGEREALLPLPAAPYALATWKQAKLHPDCHVVFDHAFYSAPHRLIGQKLWVRGADTSPRIFHQHELVATHPRATRRGQRLTTPDHVPPAKVAGLLATPASCLRRAEEIGAATTEVIGRLLGERPLDRLRTAVGILKLAHKFGPRRLEAACARAVQFDDLSYGRCDLPTPAGP